MWYPGSCSYAEMNDMAACAPVGSAGVTILPFGNGAERVLENREIGCSMHGINFNIHTRSHVLRAAQEGIVFSFIYGMKIMENMGMEIKKIHAGNAKYVPESCFQRNACRYVGRDHRTL